MEEEDPTLMAVTCHTAGCPVCDVTYNLPMYPNSWPPIWRAECTQCEQMITDIVPAAA